MTTITITRDGDVLTFKHIAGTDANASVKVIEATARLTEMAEAGELDRGGLIKVTGQLLVPVAAVFGHMLAHRFSVVAFFVPPMNAYVVASVHGDPTYKVGDVIAA